MSLFAIIASVVLVGLLLWGVIAIATERDWRKEEQDALYRDPRDRN